MYSYLYIIALAHLAFLPPGKTNWVVLKTSSLEITGRTNVNHFSCGVPQYTEADTLRFLPDGAEPHMTGIALSGTLRLDIDQFDCRSRVMTSEFKKALQYGKYPQLTIRFISLEKMPGFTSQPEFIRGQVKIGLAGVTRSFEIDYAASRSDRCAVELTGVRSLSFHDFGLKAPHKMGGLVKVNDSLRVRFTLCLRQVE